MKGQGEMAGTTTSSLRSMTELQYGCGDSVHWDELTRFTSHPSVDQLAAAGQFQILMAGISR